MNLTLLNRITLLLAFAGMFVAGVLSLAHLLNIVPPCGASGGCGTVASHPSSHWFGIPVAYFGFFSYFTLAGLAIVRALKGVAENRGLVTVGYVISAIGTVVSMALTAYAFFVIGATCTWCLASAAIMVGNMVVYAVLAQRLAALEAPRRGDEPAAPAEPRGGPFDVKLLAGLGLALVVSLGMMGANMEQKARRTAVDVEAVKKYTVADYAPEDAHAMGAEDPAITIVEFADMMCAACRKAYPGLHSLIEENPTTLRVVFRHYPLYQNPEHQLSLPASFIAEYAAQTGKFWQYLDMVYGGEDAPQNSDELFAMARTINLDVQEIQERMADDNDPIYDRIMGDLEVANGSGFMETPTFVVIKKTGEIAFANARTLPGLLEEPDYRRLLKPNATP